MTIATIKIEIGNPRIPSKWQPIELPLQAGALYTIIPPPLLGRLGIRAYIKQKFSMPDGRRVIRRKGVAKFRYKKKIGGSDVIFGKPGDSTVIGELTLGSLGLQLDRRTGELKPLPMILASSQPDTFPPRAVQ